MPSEEEIIKEWAKVKEKAPGEDDIRMIYLKSAPIEFQKRIVKMIQTMFTTSAEYWDDIVKVGIIIPLHKKGAKDNPDNFRGVCLLSMVSRILARILTTRLRDWGEEFGALDDNQDGFRQHRSTTDTTQIMVRLQEDNRRICESQSLNRDRACLLDLRKAYPRINRPLLWKILESYGFEDNFLGRLKELHEVTSYKVKGNKEVSSEWIPQRGLREGCPSSPMLFNIFHQITIRAAEKQREDNGIRITYVPGNTCMTQRRDKQNAEAKHIDLKYALFADDTTILSNRESMDVARDTTKRVMGLFEEKTNDSKEENITLGKTSAAGTRFLGLWLGEAEDTKVRLQRGMGAWTKVKRRLKNSRLTKRTQARVVEAVVESTMLYNCQVRTWNVSEINRIQRKVDQCYRYVWSSKTQPPLKEMEQKHKNSWNVRKELRIKSVRSKIEKRSMKRLGHMIRMPDDRRVKHVTFGWLSKLEETEKPRAKYRCTPRQWIKLMCEAGIDQLDIEEMAKDRKQWKTIIKNRMTHLERWEESQENGWEGGIIKRSQREESVNLGCSQCEKVCKSRAGRAVHIRRMHRENAEHTCIKCHAKFPTKTNLKNHEKKCRGTTSPTKYVPATKECPMCNKLVSATNLARHMTRSCRKRHGGP